MRLTIGFSTLAWLAFAPFCSVHAQVAQDPPAESVPPPEQGSNDSGRMMMHHGQTGMVSQPVDLATAKLSILRVFHVSISHQPDDFTINQMHSCVLRISTPAGEPVSNASVSVDGGMPAHGHGLPTSPRMTKYLGGGKYLLEGLKFNMPGLWNLQFDIVDGTRSDSVTFNVLLN